MYKRLIKQSQLGKQSFGSKTSPKDLQKCTKLVLSFQAPIITVPAHSTSNNAVVAHLGTISVFNSFSLAPDKAKNKDGVPAVLDYMNVSLTDLHMQRFV